MVEPVASQSVESKQLRCPGCNAETQWDPAVAALKCLHCSTVVQVPQQEGSHTAVEYDLEKGLAMASRGYGVAVRTSTCKECGATVSFGEMTTATRCDFCDSPQVMVQEGSRNVIRPESLVPFHVDKGAAGAKFSSWLGKLWFRPNDLKAKASVEELHGVYIPYWTFDAEVASRWTAESGEHYYVKEGDRRVQKTRWRWTSGRREDSYDDLLVCASKGLPRELAAKLKTFNTQQLKPWDPSFLAGWKAEEYAIDLNGAWKEAVARIESTQRSRCASDVPGDTHRFLNVKNTLSDEKFKHVLLPLWIASYRYREQVYRFLVNGQTGEVTGKAPWSVVKILAFIVVIIAIIAGLAVLSGNRR